MGEDTTTQTPAAATPPAKKTDAAPKPAPRKRKTKPALEGGDKTTPATQLDEEVRDVPPSFDLVGDDGRRIARSWSRDACKELQHRIATSTGERTRIVDASPFSSIQLDTGA